MIRVYISFLCLLLVLISLPYHLIFGKLKFLIFKDSEIRQLSDAESLAEKSRVERIQARRLTPGFRMAAIPIIILFIFLMKLFVRGMTDGAVKG